MSIFGSDLTPEVGPISVGTTGVLLFNKNSDRLSLTVQNASTGTIYLLFSTTGILAGTTAYNFVMSGTSYQYVTVDNWQGCVYATATTAATPVGIFEVATSTGSTAL